MTNVISYEFPVKRPVRRNDPKTFLFSLPLVYCVSVYKALCCCMSLCSTNELDLELTALNFDVNCDFFFFSSDANQNSDDQHGCHGK